jgi:hypothetical protein
MSRLRLAPDERQRLEVLARMVAGARLLVHPARKCPDFAWLGESLENGAPVIHLADSLDLAAFRAATRPGIALKDIPEDKIYEFIVRHELSHLVHRDRDACLAAARSGEAGLAERVCRECETRADREAWAAILESVTNEGG